MFKSLELTQATALSGADVSTLDATMQQKCKRSLLAKRYNSKPGEFMQPYVAYIRDEYAVFWGFPMYFLPRILSDAE